MDYEKKYKEALERAQNAADKGLVSQDFVSDIFPELPESEDERIRKELIGHCKDLVRMSQDDKVMLSVYEPWLAYLKKQKEQKPVKLNDDTEVGLDRALQIVKAAKGNLCGYQSDDGIYECCHAIQTLESILKNGIEQKPVHTAKEMWKEMRLEVYAQASGNRHEPNYSDDSTKMFSLCDIDEIFEKIGNSTVGSQPAEWSEEDENHRKDAILAIQEYRSECIKKYGKDPAWADCVDWLKSINPQPKQEWSEEDEFFRRQLIVYCENCVQDTLAAKCVDWLKSLRPQPHWKPSKEQMNVLSGVKSLVVTKDKKAYAILTSLEKDLEKL